MCEAYYPCPKCDGKGEISAFSSVLGGVCFCCGGSGRKRGKAPVKAQRWSFCANGKAYVHRKAKTEQAALTAAQVFFSNSPSEELRSAKVTVRPANF